MQKDHARRRTRRQGRFSVALVALAVSIATSFSIVAFAGAQESVGGSGNASFDSNTNTLTGSGSTSPGGSCAGTGQSTQAGTGGSTSCTTPQGSCATAANSTSAPSTVAAAGSGSCSTESGNCSASGGGGSTSQVGESGGAGAACTTSAGSCSGSGAGASSTAGQDITAGGQCTRAAESSPSVSIDGQQTAEGHSGSHSVSFTLSLSQASVVPVLVHAKTADASATIADNDYEATDAWVLFAPGVTQMAVSVPVNGDRKVESDEAFSVVLSGAQPSGVTIADGTGTGTITNDDATSSGSGTTTPGGGSTAGGSASAGGSVGQGGAQASGNVNTTPRAARPRCVVPNLRGMTVKEARAALRAANCRPGGRIPRYSAKVARGRVVNAAPQAGQSRRNGALVAMIVSMGKRPLSAKTLQAKKNHAKEQLKQGKKIDAKVDAHAS